MTAAVLPKQTRMTRSRAQFPVPPWAAALELIDHWISCLCFSEVQTKKGKAEVTANRIIMGGVV